MTSSLPLELLTRFFQGLSHELRTPLSVISNELFLLDCEGQPVEVAREKVQQIDLLLREFEPLLRSEEEPSRLNLQELALEAARGLPLSIREGFGEWSGRREHLRGALSILFRTLSDAQLLASPEVVIEPHALLLTVGFPLEIREDERSLLSYLLPCGRSAENPRVAVLDALLLADGVRCSLNAPDQLRLVQEGEMSR